MSELTDVDRLISRVYVALNSGRDRAVVQVVLDETDALRREVETLQQSLNTMDHFADVAETCERKANESHQRREDAEAAIAKVRALADEWDNLDPGLTYHMVHRDYVSELTDVLGES